MSKALRCDQCGEIYAHEKYTTAQHTWYHVTSLLDRDVKYNLAGGQPMVYELDFCSMGCLAVYSINYNQKWERLE